MPNGRTAHNLLGLPIDQEKFRPLTPQQLAKLRSRFVNTSAILVDEISTQTPQMLGQINIRCQEITGKTTDFGGLTSYLLGDFCQMPPVPNIPLFSNVLSPQRMYAQNQFYTSGINLFQKFKLVNFQQQMRAANNVQHTAILTQLRDLNQTHTVNSDVINYIQQHVLSPADISRDPSWAWATTAVTSNAERLTLNHFNLQQYAKFHGEFCFKICCEIFLTKF